ncbi:protein Njmu-R1 [Lampetra fluviatilis]
MEAAALFTESTEEESSSFFREGEGGEGGAARDDDEEEEAAEAAGEAAAAASSARSFTLYAARGCGAKSRKASITDTLQQQEASDQDLRLTVVASDLAAECEAELRSFIARRLEKGALYGSIGSVATLNLTSADDSTACYYCLLQQPLPAVAESVESAESAESVESAEPGEPGEDGGSGREEGSNGAMAADYVICFLGLTEQGLELFRPELDKYAAGLLAYLDAEVGTEGWHGATYLGGWLEDAVLYIHRVLRTLNGHIAMLLHAALSHAHVDVVGANEKLSQDISRFVQTSRLEGLMPGSPSACPQSAGDSMVTVDCSTDSPSVRNGTSNRFCDTWADALTRAAETGSAFVLRQILENFKLKAIQDMNSFQRLLNQAESDHYALYRCLQFVRACGNGGVLLSCPAMGPGLVPASRPAALSVLRVLAEFTRENGETP